METIIAYLNNMFLNFPHTEEVKRAKANLLECMEDKYNELKAEGKSENEAIGIVISEFGNIDELSEALGGIKDDNDVPYVTGETAQEYMSIKRKYGTLIAFGVMLCILSPVPLILMNEVGKTLMEIVGITWLLVSVAVAVTLFIFSSIKMKDYSYLEDPISLDATAKMELQEEYRAFKPKNSIAFAAGVALCILSPLGLMIGSMLNVSTMVELYFVVVLLVIVSIAVFIFIRFSNINEAYGRLLQIDDYTPENKKTNKVFEAVSDIVWPLAVVVFLVWGIGFDGWGYSWLVFPIVGILEGGFFAIHKLMQSKQN